MHELAVGCLDTRYAALRLVDPDAERALVTSLRELGQLVPIVVCDRDGALSIIDGFKRLAAARVLGLEVLRARIMPLGETAALAAMATLNRHGRGLTDLEEARIVRALCRDHGLDQTAIGELLGHHKSWVSRRLALAERVADAVLDDVRAGLLTATIAREVARLPRGNQIEVAAAVRRHALTSRDASRLVTLFERTSELSQQRQLLDAPRESLDADRARAVLTRDPRLGPATDALRHELYLTMRSMTALAARLDRCTPSRWTDAERNVVGPILDKALSAAELCAAMLRDSVGAVEMTDAA